MDADSAAASTTLKRKRSADAGFSSVPIHTSVSNQNALDKIDEKIIVLQSPKVDATLQTEYPNLHAALATSKTSIQDFWSTQPVSALQVMLEFCAVNCAGILTWSSALLAQHPNALSETQQHAFMAQRIQEEVESAKRKSKESFDAACMRERAEALELLLARLPSSTQTREHVLEREKCALETEKRAVEAEARLAAEKAAVVKARLESELAFATSEAERRIKACEVATSAANEARVQGFEGLAAAARKEAAQARAELANLKKEVAESHENVVKLTNQLREAREEHILRSHSAPRIGVEGEILINSLIQSALGDSVVLKVVRALGEESDARLCFVGAAKTRPKTRPVAVASNTDLLSNSNEKPSATTEQDKTDFVETEDSGATGDVVLLIETKNRADVRSPEIEKFRGDLVRSNAQGGVMFSLRCAANGCSDGVLHLERLSDGRPLLIVNNFSLIPSAQRVAYIKSVMNLALDAAKLAFFNADVFLEHEDEFQEQIRTINSDLCALHIAKYHALGIQKVLTPLVKDVLARMERLRQNVINAETVAKRYASNARDDSITEARSESLAAILGVYGLDPRPVVSKFQQQLRTRSGAATKAAKASTMAQLTQRDASRNAALTPSNDDSKPSNSPFLNSSACFSTFSAASATASTAAASTTATPGGLGASGVSQALSFSLPTPATLDPEDTSSLCMSDF